MKQFLRAISILCIMLICLISLTPTAIYAEEAMEMNAAGAILIEQSTGEILFEKNADEPLAIASITKVMTSLLLVEAVERGEISLSDTTTVSETAMGMGGTSMFLNRKETVTFEDLLKGMRIASGNDAAYVVGEHLGGSMDGFLTMMNDRATQLGMTNTTFKNPHGLPDSEHLSSAKDVAIMSRELMKYEDIIVPITTVIWEDYIHNDGRETLLANTNKDFINGYEGAIGLKTGYTSDAGFCLSSVARRDGMTLIAVVLNCPDKDTRMDDITTMFDYGFGAYSVKNVVEEKELVHTNQAITGGTIQEIGVLTKTSLTTLTAKNENKEYTQKVHLPKTLRAPILEGDTVGYMEVYDGDKLIGEIDLVSDTTVEKATFFEIFAMLFQNLFSVLRTSV